MKAFATLLDRLVLTPSRNGKLGLLVEYFRSAPDPDRGFALAALTDGLFPRLPLRRALGELMTFSPEECQVMATPEGIRGRAHLMWTYFTRLEARWDRQPGTGIGPLA